MASSSGVEKVEI